MRFVLGGFLDPDIQLIAAIRALFPIDVIGQAVEINAALGLQDNDGTGMYLRLKLAGQGQHFVETAAVIRERRTEKDDDRFGRRRPAFDPAVDVGASDACGGADAEVCDVVFEFGTWTTRVASRQNDDGSFVLVTLDPTYDPLEFIITEHAGKRALIVQDGQHEHVYDEAPPP